MKTPITESSDWTVKNIDAYFHEIERIAKEDLHLDVYPNEIQIVTAEQMLDAYAFGGMPVMYPHWTFGRDYIFTQKSYEAGNQNLAYEMVINSNPCISYLMEENTMLMDILVMAHACFGHNSVFKHNYLFRQWTDAESIIGYLQFAKNYVEECEERYGKQVVKQFLTACHSIKMYGVDKYKRPQKLSVVKEKARQKERIAYQQSQVNELWRTLPAELAKARAEDDAHEEFKKKKIPSEPQENILYFLEKNAPHLEGWKRELIRIVRKVAQYYHPQRHTQIVNEGFATFTHYNILNKLKDENLINDGFFLEFLTSHTNVVNQPDVHSKYYNGRINPYYLGFNMFQDIRRICENPTAEDKEWFPNLCGTDWRQSTLDAMSGYKDESFITQYLSPHLIRKLHLIEVQNDEDSPHLVVSEIHDEEGYKTIRDTLAWQSDPVSYLPDVQVLDADITGSRRLLLRAKNYNKRRLNEEHVILTMKNIEIIWGYKVHLVVVDENDKEVAKFVA
jgi:stage V sporulation protein R